MDRSPKERVENEGRNEKRDSFEQARISGSAIYLSSHHTLGVLRHPLLFHSIFSSASLHLFTSQLTTMATNAFSTRSSLPQTLALTPVSGLRSASVSCFGRKNVSFSLQPRSIRLQISCAAKPETVEKVAKIVKEQLALDKDTAVTGESKFATLGADSLDTVEIVMALEEQFGIAVEEDSAQSITTVQEAADLIEDLVSKKCA